MLDVGCGPGVDLVAIGASKSVGLDPSWAMCATAQSSARTIVRGDAHNLPFSDGAFDAVRADRVVQHLAQPGDALREFVRVLRPGGRIVIADPDQESLVIQVPGAPRGMLDRLKALRRDIGYRNGRLASELPSRLTALGVEHMTVEAFPLLILNPDEAFGLPSWPLTWRERGGFTDDELEQWAGAIDCPGTPGFVYLVTFLVVSGVTP